MAFRTFLHNETTDFAGCHPSLATRTASVWRIAQDRTRLEPDATSKAEARVIEIARHALGTDQSAAIHSARNRGSAIVAVLVALTRNGATSAASMGDCIYALRRGRFEFRPTNTVKRTPRNTGRDIVLSMTVGAGNKLHAPRIGPS